MDQYIISEILLYKIVLLILNETKYSEDPNNISPNKYPKFVA